jgi:hypothetical protein
VIAPANRPAPVKPRPGTSALLSGAAQYIWSDIPAFTAFAHEVEDALEAGELRYSVRLELLKRAAHFGIGRFDANLIIAMVQNRVAEWEFVDDNDDQAHRPRRSSWLRMVAMFVAVQFLILVVAWCLLG